MRNFEWGAIQAHMRGEIVSIPKRDYEEFREEDTGDVYRSLINVSIPKRDYEEFRDVNVAIAVAESGVSIPKRDYEEFRGLPSGTLTLFGFQGAFARDPLILTPIE